MRNEGKKDVRNPKIDKWEKDHSPGKEFSYSGMNQYLPPTPPPPISHTFHLFV